MPQKFCILEGLERGEDHDDAPLDVIGAGAFCDRAAADEVLERAVGFEHGVEVRNHQDPLALVAFDVMFGHQVPGAAQLRHWNEGDAKTKRFETGAQQFGDAGHARQVQR